jgi:uncharacterized membrane protein
MKTYDELMSMIDDLEFLVFDTKEHYSKYIDDLIADIKLLDFDIVDKLLSYLTDFTIKNKVNIKDAI